MKGFIEGLSKTSLRIFSTKEGGWLPPNMQLIFWQNKYRGWGYQLVPQRTGIFVQKHYF